jgi:hypothetical protein
MEKQWKEWGFHGEEACDTARTFRGNALFTGETN